MGILPDLFREGQGVVTLGMLRPDGIFAASEVLAKHDETYMPKEVAEALKGAGTGTRAPVRRRLRRRGTRSRRRTPGVDRLVTWFMASTPHPGPLPRAGEG